MKSNLYSFCGTHGVGKTTVCLLLNNLGYAVDTNSLPRAAQKELGWDKLTTVMDSEENMWAMQDTVLRLLRERDKRILESGVITFVDRSPVDLAGYMYLWAKRREWKIDQERYIAYQNACHDECAKYAAQLYVPIRKEIPFVAEDNRGDEASRMINQEAMVDFMCSRNIEYKYVESLAPYDRVREVLDYMEFLQRTSYVRRAPGVAA